MEKEENFEILNSSLNKNLQSTSVSINNRLNKIKKLSDNQIKVVNEGKPFKSSRKINPLVGKTKRKIYDAKNQTYNVKRRNYFKGKSSEETNFNVTINGNGVKLTPTSDHTTNWRGTKRTTLFKDGKAASFTERRGKNVKLYVADKNGEMQGQYSIKGSSLRTLFRQNKAMIRSDKDGKTITNIKGKRFSTHSEVDGQSVLVAKKGLFSKTGLVSKSKKTSYNTFNEMGKSEKKHIETNKDGRKKSFLGGIYSKTDYKYSDGSYKQKTKILGFIPAGSHSLTKAKSAKLDKFLGAAKKSNAITGDLSKSSKRRDLIEKARSGGLGR